MRRLALALGARRSAMTPAMTVCSAASRSSTTRVALTRWSAASVVTSATRWPAVSALADLASELGPSQVLLGLNGQATAKTAERASRSVTFASENGWGMGVVRTVGTMMGGAVARRVMGSAAAAFSALVMRRRAVREQDVLRYRPRLRTSMNTGPLVCAKRVASRAGAGESSRMRDTVER